MHHQVFGFRVRRKSQSPRYSLDPDMVVAWIYNNALEHHPAKTGNGEDNGQSTGTLGIRRCTGIAYETTAGSVHRSAMSVHLLACEWHVFSLLFKLRLQPRRTRYVLINAWRWQRWAMPQHQPLRLRSAARDHPWPGKAYSLGSSRGAGRSTWRWQPSSS